MGAQGNVWTEYITDFRQVEYMAVPRMFALSETLWSDAKFYKDFIYRLKKQAKLLDKMKINYAKHFLK
jgi:hexosaminidase